MRTVADLDFRNKRALVRVDFNVPLNDSGEVADDTRIRGALPTIRKILHDGGSVILMSHLGRPKDREDKFSLRQVVDKVSALLQTEVKMAPDCTGAEVRQLAEDMKPGDVLLLENLRFHAGEKQGNESFATELAALADVYVNDAFGTAHRAHASTTVAARFFGQDAKAAGLLMARELEMAAKLLHHSERPFTAILGGAKVSDKIPLISSLLDKVNNILIGGAMAYTFVRAQGGETGRSLVEEERITDAANILKKAAEKGVKIVLPEDSVIGDRVEDSAKATTCPSAEIPDNWLGLDIGPEAIKDFGAVLRISKTIFWNGPMGVFELKPFAAGTFSVAQLVADATTRGAFSMVGGGDSVSAVTQMKVAGSISFISTGGGAMLEYLEGKELPGIKALSE